MVDKVKKGDHVEIVYVGKEKLTGRLFDLNDEEFAKKENVQNPNHKYEGHIVCIGQKDVLEGLDGALEGKELGKKFKVEITPEKGFGKQDSRLMQLVSLSKFKEGRPHPGMQVDLKGRVGLVKTVSGGRVMIDFNHPLAGKYLVYEVKINKIITDDAEKVKSFIKMYLNMETKVDINDSKATIGLEIPDKFQEEIANQIKKRVPSLKKVEFKAPSEEKPKKTASKKE